MLDQCLTDVGASAKHNVHHTLTPKHHRETRETAPTIIRCVNFRGNEGWLIRAQVSRPSQAHGETNPNLPTHTDTRAYRRQARLLHDIAQHPRGHRRELGRFAHTGVAAGNRGCNLHTRQEDRRRGVSIATNTTTTQLSMEQGESERRSSERCVGGRTFQVRR